MKKQLLIIILIAITLGTSALISPEQFARATSFSVSITPRSASINVGDSLDFNSTVTDAPPSYTYQWFLNGIAFEGATSASWTFTPPTKGFYNILLRVYPYPFVNDSSYVVAQSEIARIVVGEKAFLGSFGYPYGSQGAGGSGTQYTTDGSKFMLNVEANITSMSCLMEDQSYADSLNANYSYSFAIYRDNNGAVGSLVAQTVQGIMTYDFHDIALWYTLDFPSVVHLAPGAYWLLAVHNASNRVLIYNVYDEAKDNYESVSSVISGMTFPTALPSPTTFTNFVYCIYASWEVDFSATLSEENKDFSVASNSTVSPLSYSSERDELSFNVSGASGTNGYAQVFISKNTLPDVSDVNVGLDGNTWNFTTTSLGDSWVLHFVYSHSTHNVAIDMQVNTIPEFSTPLLAVLLAITFATVCVLVIHSRKSREHKGFDGNKTATTEA
jgi:hypothetical protein